MGTHASVRGWLEADRWQRAAVEAVIEAARRDCTPAGGHSRNARSTGRCTCSTGATSGRPSCRSSVSRSRGWPPCLPRATTTAGCRQLRSRQSSRGHWTIRHSKTCAATRGLPHRAVWGFQCPGRDGWWRRSPCASRTHAGHGKQPDDPARPPAPCSASPKPTTRPCAC